MKESEPLYVGEFRLQGGDADVRITAARSGRIDVGIESLDGSGGLQFGFGPGDAGRLAVKLLEAMSAANREHAARLMAEARERGWVNP